jgi:hypothetical protein
MTFKFTFRVDPVGMTVPYAAIADDIRNNSGFEDLRGRPDKASAIADGNASPALRRLHVRIANVGSTIFTLGCELGSHQEPTHVPMRRREEAGGYVQFASIQYNRATAGRGIGRAMAGQKPSRAQGCGPVRASSMARQSRVGTTEC